MANLRAAYAEVSTAVLTGESSENTTNIITKGEDGSYSETVTLQQVKADWTGDEPKIGNATINGKPKEGTGNTATVKADKNGKVTITF